MEYVYKFKMTLHLETCQNIKTDFITVPTFQTSP
jgi:hypothetical protein